MLKTIQLAFVTGAILLVAACHTEPDEPAGNTEKPIGAHATIALGTETQAKAFFSYPNSCNAVVCYQDETLAETIKRWFDTSFTRDGFEGATAVRRNEDGNYFIDVTLANPNEQARLPEYVRRYEQFVQHGKTAVELARLYNSVEKKWLPNWRFLLPHGLPMTNNRTLEVMNFPPVSLVLKTQNYLCSNTTRRWNEMFLANGVKAENLDLYGAILDVVPVAAPASEGKKLRAQGIYDGHFNDYAKAMIAMWTEVPEQPTQSKPIMTLGAEMKDWFKQAYGIEEGLQKVLDVSYVPFSSTRKSPIMFTNHPSKIFYSASYQQALKTMTQDTVANCWQAEMGKEPSSDALQMKTFCHDRWADQEHKMCELVLAQVCNANPTQADTICSQLASNQPLAGSSQSAAEKQSAHSGGWCEALDPQLSSAPKPLQCRL